MPFIGKGKQVVQVRLDQKRRHLSLGVARRSHRRRRRRLLGGHTRSVGLVQREQAAIHVESPDVLDGRQVLRRVRLDVLRVNVESLDEGCARRERLLQQHGKYWRV